MLTGILFRVTTIARNWRQQSLLLAYGLPDAAPARLLGTAMEILPVPKWKASAHARVCDDAGLVRILLSRHGPSRLLRKHQRPELVLRRSISSLRTPLSTLRLQPHDRTCITRGRCGSYAFTVTDLHRLSSPVSRRTRPPYQTCTHKPTFEPVSAQHEPSLRQFKSDTKNRDRRPRARIA